MKTTLYMAMTVNGFIATPEGDSGWVSDADEKNFRDMAKRVGNVIMGRGTYDYLMDHNTFPIPDTLNVVMTSNPPDVDPIKNVVFMDASPEEVLANLEERGFSEALVAGGGQLSGSFMSDGLVDEMYLTVEPVIMGSGIHLFENGEFQRALELLDTRSVSASEIQLHYAVRKHTLDSYMGEG